MIACAAQKTLSKNLPRSALAIAIWVILNGPCGRCDKEWKRSKLRRWRSSLAVKKCVQGIYAMGIDLSMVGKRGWAIYIGMCHVMEIRHSGHWPSSVLTGFAGLCYTALLGTAGGLREGFLVAMNIAVSPLFQLSPAYGREGQPTTEAYCASVDLWTASEARSGS